MADAVGRFVADIAGAEAYVRAQESAGVDTADLMKRMVVSRKEALNDMTFDESAAGRITEAIVRRGHPGTTKDGKLALTHIAAYTHSCGLCCGEAHTCATDIPVRSRAG